MKIAIITDTWDTINGVVTTLKATVQELQARGHSVLVIEPSLFKTIPCYGYPEIRISLNLYRVKTLLDRFSPNAIHIATEGPLGLAARFYCRYHREIAHTSSYHTKFPEYLNIYYGLPLTFTYSYLRWFHSASNKVLIPTRSLREELETLKFKHLAIWSRGVDRDIFYPVDKQHTDIPVLLCVSRVSREKNLDVFCQLPGKKILVGDGPYLKELQDRYPDVIYVGYKTGHSLANFYQQADVFVFPSRSDTFGVVMIEAMACGTPVAAYPVTGPKDIVIEKVSGYLEDNLLDSVTKCLSLSREQVYQQSLQYTWKHATDIFESSLVRLN